MTVITVIRLLPCYITTKQLLSTLKVGYAGKKCFYQLIKSLFFICQEFHAHFHSENCICYSIILIHTMIRYLMLDFYLFPSFQNFPIFRIVFVLSLFGIILQSLMQIYSKFEQIRKNFGSQVEAFFVILTALQFHMLFYCTRPLPNILAFGLGNFNCTTIVLVARLTVFLAVTRVYCPMCYVESIQI